MIYLIHKETILKSFNINEVMESHSSTFAWKRKPLYNNWITPFNSNFQGQRFDKNIIFKGGFFFKTPFYNEKKESNMPSRTCFHFGKNNHVQRLLWKTIGGWSKWGEVL